MEEITHVAVETKKKTQAVKEITTPMAIILAGAMIAGSILIGFSWIKTGGSPSNKVANPKDTTADVSIGPVGPKDRVFGNSKAKVTLVMYEDFQCPFCGKFFKEVEVPVREKYVQDGKVQIVYRDYAFLGAESVRSAMAAHCAGDQNKFWEYHDYLYTHQNGENQGAFSDTNLKSFAKTLGLNEASFNQCFDSGKYTKTVGDSIAEASDAGVQGTPKGFILVDGKVVSTIDGAEPLTMVTGKLDKALK